MFEIFNQNEISFILKICGKGQKFKQVGTLTEEQAISVRNLFNEFAKRNLENAKAEQKA